MCSVPGSSHTNGYEASHISFFRLKIVFYCSKMKLFCFQQQTREIMSEQRNLDEEPPSLNDNLQPV